MLKSHPSIAGVGGALLVLAGAAMLDLAQRPAAADVALRSDRADMAATSNGCGTLSFMAACAKADTLAGTPTRGAYVTQAFTQQGQTTLVRIRLGD